MIPFDNEVRYTVHDQYGVIIHRSDDAFDALTHAQTHGPGCAVFEVDDDGRTVRLVG